MPGEQAIVGWAEIAKMFNVSRNAMMKRRKELKEAGVIFYMINGHLKRRMVCAFPSALKAWITKKSVMGQDF